MSAKGTIHLVRCPTWPQAWAQPNFVQSNDLIVLIDDGIGLIDDEAGLTQWPCPVQVLVSDIGASIWSFPHIKPISLDELAGLVTEYDHCLTWDD